MDIFYLLYHEKYQQSVYRHQPEYCAEYNEYRAYCDIVSAHKIAAVKAIEVNNEAYLRRTRKRVKTRRGKKT